jgi:hypothetical protein
MVTFLAPLELFILPSKRTDIAQNTKKSTHSTLQPTLPTLMADNGHGTEILFMVIKSDKELIFLFRVIVGMYRKLRCSN